MSPSLTLAAVDPPPFATPVVVLVVGEDSLLVIGLSTCLRTVGGMTVVTVRDPEELTATFATDQVGVVLVCGDERLVADTLAALPAAAPPVLSCRTSGPAGAAQDDPRRVWVLDHDAPVEHVVEQIRSCLDGAVLGPARLSVAQSSAEPGRPPADSLDVTAPAPVSKRELQVLQLASVGQTNCAIARALGLSEATVKTYWQRIFVKVGSRDRTAAVAVAVTTGMIRGPRPTEHTAT